MFVSTTHPCFEMRYYLWVNGDISGDPHDPYKAIVYEFIDYRKRVITGNSLSSIFTFDYPSVTYQEVTEYIGDVNGNNTGKIVYNYSRADFPTRRLTYSLDQYAYMDRYWDRPRLLSTAFFKNQGGGIYTPVKRNSISYHRVESDTTKSWTIRRYGHFTNYSVEGLIHQLTELENNFTTYFPRTFMQALQPLRKNAASNIHPGEIPLLQNKLITTQTMIISTRFRWSSPIVMVQ
jgi:hypothetical protein